MKPHPILNFAALLLGCFLFASAGAAPEAPAKNESAATLDSKIDAAAAAFQAGRYTEAAGLFREAVALDPRHVKAWYFLGQSLAKSGDWPRAREAYEKVLEIQPTGPLAERTRSLLAAPPASAKPAAAASGDTFRDCPECPEMVAIPGKNYAIGKYEVTQGQWRAVMGSNPSHFNSCGDDCPVENVSWDDTQEYLRKLNQKTGKQYRLPSEAEWEYACYGGRQPEYCGGNNVSAVAWYDNNSDGKTHPVGQKQPNGYGLYDMSGNVWEWTNDCWLDDCTKRALRGGSWSLKLQSVRAAERGWSDSAFRFNKLGFRLVRTLP